MQMFLRELNKKRKLIVLKDNFLSHYDINNNYSIMKERGKISANS